MSSEVKLRPETELLICRTALWDWWQHAVESERLHLLSPAASASANYVPRQEASAPGGKAKWTVQSVNVQHPPKLIPVGLNTVLEGGFFCTRMIKTSCRVTVNLKKILPLSFLVSNERFCSYWCFSFLQIWLIQSGNGYFTFWNFGSSVLAFLSPPRWEELRREEERRVRATRRQWTAPMVWCHRHYTETGHSA